MQRKMRVAVLAEMILWYEKTNFYEMKNRDKDKYENDAKKEKTVADWKWMRERCIKKKKRKH